MHVAACCHGLRGPAAWQRRLVVVTAPLAIQHPHPHQRPTEGARLVRRGEVLASQPPACVHSCAVSPPHLVAAAMQARAVAEQWTCAQAARGQNPAQTSDVVARQRRRCLEGPRALQTRHQPRTASQGWVGLAVLVQASPAHPQARENRERAGDAVQRR